MADIELVIRIPEEDYERCKKKFQMRLNVMAMAIAKGTPLPKGHGDLKDTEKLKNTFIKWSMAVCGNFTDTDIASIICNSPTIIKADKDKEVNDEADND